MKFLAVTVLGACLILCGGQTLAQQSSDSKFSLFDTAQAAQHHCPFDTIVWLDTKTDTYTMTAPSSEKGQGGAYMCQREADQMDYHLSQTNK